MIRETSDFNSENSSVEFKRHTSLDSFVATIGDNSSK